MKHVQFATLTLDKIVGGGQAMGTLEDGRKAFVWGGLPGEKVTISITKKKSHFVEGVVTEVLEASKDRTEPKDTSSYLSTSPWQIMTFDAEQHYKSALIEEAFELHNIVLPNPIEVYSDGRAFGYRNKLEFSWYGHEVDGVETLDLSFFARGSHGKIPVEGSSLAIEAINVCARAVRDTLRRNGVTARELKTLLIRADQRGNCSWQLYIKDKNPAIMSESQMQAIGATGGEIIYSDPKSPASRITARLVSTGDTLEDTILGTTFRYATEGFFQINLPVYEQALRDMQMYLADSGASVDSATPAQAHILNKPLSLRDEDCLSKASSAGAKERGERKIRRAEAVAGTIEARPKTIDLYSGVGSIGLTIGGANCTLVEIDENAVREMRRNIKEQGSTATPVLAASENALEYITGDMIVIVDPPRAGLHTDVIARLLETKPPRIIYLSCNPVTQARDVALLAEGYGIADHRGYNFFPRTPHIEHLVVLDRTT